MVFITIIDILYYKCQQPESNKKEEKFLMENALEMLNDPEVIERFGFDQDSRLIPNVLHDICVPDVKYICTQPIDLYVPIPATGGDLVSGSCRNELIPLTPDVSCDVSVICAEESLKPNCLGVDIKVGFQIVLTPPPNTNLCPTLVINHYQDFECTTFCPFPSGAPISGDAVRNALKKIDGSCVVVKDLCCHIDDGQCSRVHIQGTLIDKLWKHENLIVLAVKPYGGVTVCQEFPEPHKIGKCEPCPVTPNGVRCGCC
jgi:hypothetical protein